MLEFVFALVCLFWGYLVTQYPELFWRMRHPFLRSMSRLWEILTIIGGYLLMGHGIYLLLKLLFA